MSYEPASRQRNQRNIVLGAAMWILLIILVALVRDTGVAPAVAGIVFVLIVSGLFWWLFAARGAEPLPAGRKFARMWWVSKKWEDKYG